MEESELADSDAENKLNPDEYEDDTTEFGQSEVAANDSQNEVCIHLYFFRLTVTDEKVQVKLETDRKHFFQLRH